MLINLNKAVAYPAQIMLIRHAEKPIEKSEVLSEKGFRRAEALAKIFDLYPSLALNGIPDYFFATKFGPGENSRRTYLTLEPLAKRLNRQISAIVVKEDFQFLVQELLTNPIYNEKSIVIAWTHSYIPKMAKALGSAPQNKWDSDVFDRIWLLQFDQNGRASSVDLPQNLLPGDSL